MWYKPLILYKCQCYYDIFETPLGCNDGTKLQGIIFWQEKLSDLMEDEGLIFNLEEVKALLGIKINYSKYEFANNNWETWEIKKQSDLI